MKNVLFSWLVVLVCGVVGLSGVEKRSSSPLNQPCIGDCPPCAQWCPTCPTCSPCDSCCAPCDLCDFNHPNWPLPFPENQCGSDDGYPGDGVMLCGIGPDRGGEVDFEEYKFAYPWQSAFLVAFPDDPEVPMRINTYISRECSGGIDFTITGDPAFNDGKITTGWYFWPPRQCMQVHDGELRVMVDVVYADFTAVISKPEEVYPYE